MLKLPPFLEEQQLRLEHSSVYIVFFFDKHLKTSIDEDLNCSLSNRPQTRNLCCSSVSGQKNNTVRSFAVNQFREKSWNKDERIAEIGAYKTPDRESLYLCGTMLFGPRLYTIAYTL